MCDPDHSHHTVTHCEVCGDELSAEQMTHNVMHPDVQEHRCSPCFWAGVEANIAGELDSKSVIKRRRAMKENK